MADPGRREELIDRTTVDPGGSIRHCCRVLGLRRASYHHRKSGHRPELADHELADLLRRTTERFVSWGFWKVYHYLRQQCSLPQKLDNS